MTVYYQDDTVTLHHGDSLGVLSGMPDGSVDCCVTSPPYFGLRSYGQDGQYGLEPSPAEYVETMRAVFAEVRRVLADDGTLWLNLGDSYANGGGGGAPSGKSTLLGNGHRGGGPKMHAPAMTTPIRSDGLPSKNLIGIPWRVAFALQDDDSGDIYELSPDAPDSVQTAVYLETCRIRTPRNESDTPASTRSGGEKRTLSDTESAAKHGQTPTETRSGSTADGTTSSTASRKSSEHSEGTPAGIADCGSQHSSTTAASRPSAPAVRNGDSTSSHSTTSAAAETSTERNSGSADSTSGSTYAARDIPTATESSAITATVPSATTARARTRMNERPRLRKADIPEADLQHFRLVKQERWILRNDIIWSKPNAMPESVTDRLSSRHEHLFMLTKSRRYWFDLDPIRETHMHATAGARGPGGGSVDNWSKGLGATGEGHLYGHASGKNPGDVWNIATQPFPGAHFATMPPELARRCVLAGCKPGGTVLDPFSGSGTTGMVAAQAGLKYVGIDLNRDYLALSLQTRLAQTALIEPEETP